MIHRFTSRTRVVCMFAPLRFHDGLWYHNPDKNPIDSVLYSFWGPEGGVFDIQMFWGKGFYWAVSQSPSYHEPTVPPSYVAGPSSTCSAKDGQFQRDKRSFSRCLLTGAHWDGHKGKSLTLRKSSHMKVDDIESENSFIMAAYRHIHLQKTVAIVAAP